jgi:predicted small metal-binding protein
MIILKTEGGQTMEKEIRCRDFRSDCDFTARAATEEELLKKCMVHACDAHSKCDDSAKSREKIKSRMRDVWK